MRSPRRVLRGGGLCTIKWGFELGGRTTYWQEKFPMGWGTLIPKKEPHWYEERNRRGMQIVWRRMCRCPTTLFHTPKIANVAADNMKLITEFICNDGEVAWKREWPRPYHLAIFIPKGTSPGKMNFDEWINWIAPFPEMERKICAFGEAMRRLEMRCNFMLEVVGAYVSYEKHEQWRGVADGMQVTIWGMREDEILRRWEKMWTEELLWRAYKARARAGKESPCARGEGAVRWRVPPVRALRNYLWLAPRPPPEAGVPQVDAALVAAVVAALRATQAATPPPPVPMGAPAYAQDPAPGPTRGRCWGCGEWGHRKADCPKEPPQEGGKGRGKGRSGGRGKGGKGGKGGMNSFYIQMGW